MYGQDADLIMLGLVTHEPHFTLLREVIQFNTRFGNKGVRQAIMKQTKEASFQLLHISILREYIELDLGLGVSFAVDKERLIDDFVFLTFLVGNDFLPHLPTLDISEHAFDVIFNAYKELLLQSPGYITENGEIRDFARLEALCAIIGKQEATILKTREEDEKAFNGKRRKFADSRGSVPSEEEEEEAAEELQRAYEAAYLEAMGTLPSTTPDPETTEEEVDEADGEFTVVSRARQPAPTKILQRAPAEWLSGGAEESKSGNNEDETDPVIEPSDAFGNSLTVKDYRGQYYFKKFKIIAANTSSDDFLTRLMSDYLKGLVWCLAYYVKGCVSWTWYYPYHYGPMLIDMKNLAALSSAVSFDIGQPFQPFQQLLGCLPSASKDLLPRPYQWLMTSEQSPVLKFYPMDFQIDMDGKRNPWEAVVLLDFIDEKELLEAERNHCKPELLTMDERRRNAFGTVTTHVFDVAETSTYYSCNPDIGLIDIHHCQTSVSESVPSLLPGAYFSPHLVPGTLTAVAGFPTLTALVMNDVNTDFAKINVFGSASKYRSLVMTVQSSIKSVEASKLSVLLGKIVFVNYPQLHEARVVAVTTENEEIREIKCEDGSKQVVTIPFDTFSAKKWKSESSELEKQYLTGRGTPGSGGLDIGPVLIRLRLLPLQGMARDHKTGARYKIFGKTEADVPAQLVLWSSIVEDPRFQEVGELPVPTLYPVGCEVVCTAGEMVGSKGVVVGPHAAVDKSRSQSGGSNVSRQTSSASTNSASGKKSSRAHADMRCVDVEFTVNPPEPAFGYAIAASVQEQYFPSRDICTVLKMSPSLLGKLVGSLFVEQIRADIGLNLKRNGQYQLLGYVRRVDPACVRGTVEFTPDGNSSNTIAGPKAWGSGDTVQIVGTIAASESKAGPAGSNSAAGHTTHTDSWEYSSHAVALIVEYQDRFPVLFANLLRLPQGSPRYTVQELFGKGGSEKDVDEVLEWMKSKPFFNMPRTPLTTISMSRDAMQAVERAVDVRTSYLANIGPLPKVVVKSIPCTEIFRGDLSSPFDAPLQINVSAPRLGDRVVNLNSTGVPCGLRGTVVCIHGSTGFVEVFLKLE
jgi:5'-3' exoribonuclease 1